MYCKDETCLIITKCSQTGKKGPEVRQNRAERITVDTRGEGNWSSETDNREDSKEERNKSGVN